MSDSGRQAPKKRMVPLQDHIVFTDLPDGRVRAFFTPLQVAGEGPDRDAAGGAMVAEIQAAVSDPEISAKWTAFVEEFAVEVEDDALPDGAGEALPEGADEALHKIEALSADEFETFLDTSKVPVLIDFWATWCGPCLSMAPDMVKVAEHLEGRVAVRKVDVDQARDIAEQLEIQSIPTLVLFIDGGEVVRIIGAQPAGAVLRLLEPHLD